MEDLAAAGKALVAQAFADFFCKRGPVAAGRLIALVSIVHHQCTIKGILHGRLFFQQFLEDPAIAQHTGQAGVLSGITMVFVPSVSTFAISKMLGGGSELLLGDLIELQFFGGAYNPQLGAAISLVMMVIVVACMVLMNRFGEGEEQAVML